MNPPKGFTHLSEWFDGEKTVPVLYMHRDGLPMEAVVLDVPALLKLATQALLVHSSQTKRGQCPPTAE